MYLAGALTSVLTNNMTNQLRLADSDAVKDRLQSGELGPRVVFPSINYGQALELPADPPSRVNYILMNTTSYHLESGWGTHDFKGGFESQPEADGPRTIYTSFNGQFTFLQDRLPEPGVSSTYPGLYRTATGTGALDRDVDMYAVFLDRQLAR